MSDTPHDGSDPGDTIDYLEERLQQQQAEIERLTSHISKAERDIGHVNELSLETERQVDKLIASYQDAVDAARYMRTVLTNMTQDEQMQTVYAKWPWLKE